MTERSTAAHGGRDPSRNSPGRPAELQSKIHETTRVGALARGLAVPARRRAVSGRLSAAGGKKPFARNVYLAGAREAVDKQVARPGRD
jgi:hypothetical protein